MTLLAKIAEKVAVWRRYRETVRELSQFSDHELSDIGIRRCDIARIAASARGGVALLAAMGIFVGASLSSATNAEAQMRGWSCQAGWHAINAPNGNGYRCVPDDQ